MGLCIVDCCDTSPQGVSYFEFPTSRGLRKKWQDAVRLPCKVPLGAVVCSLHFRPDEYEPIRGKVRLKGKVVPTLLLNKTENTTTKQTDIINQDQNTENSPENDQDSDRKQKSSENNTEHCDNSSECNKNSKIDVNGSRKDGADIPETKKDAAKDRRKGSKQNGRKDKAESDICRVINKEEINDARKCIESDPNDIEEMITNYQIKNKLPNPALVPEPSIEPAVPEASTDLVNRLPRPGTELDVTYVPEKEPVFIEVSVDKNGNNPSGGEDCVMLLESVQVDIDPALLLQGDSDGDTVASGDRKDDPISLLTSSDDDEVIIEEPHIDTVEVSDETDEDDVPLVQLVKKPTKKRNSKKNDTKNIKFKFDFKDMSVFDYYCVQCRFSTSNAVEYTRHLDQHSTVLQICQICNYTTASRTQFSRHSRKHKDEKKFRCHLCEYKARHKMSLVYHLESHSRNKQNSVTITDVDRRKCKKCVKFKCVCRKKKYSCDSCSYKTEKRSDMRRHVDRKHTELLE